MSIAKWFTSRASKRLEMKQTEVKRTQRSGQLRFSSLLCVIAVLVLGANGHAAEVGIELNIKARVHFNTNVSDFETSRAFYGALGFETLSGFPDTNTVAMARAIGITEPTDYDGAHGGEAGGYHLHGELISIGGWGGGVIDLIEFTIPRNEAPPYAHLNHLGMASAAMHTVDLDGDYLTMTALGVKFIAPPATRTDGTRFAFFSDPDGTFYELIEVEGEPDADEKTQITNLAHVTINVSNLERSLAWYQMLGFEVSSKLTIDEPVEVARAMGFDQPVRADGVIVSHPADGASLALMRWRSPYDAAPPYPIPINHIGIHRMAFATTDMAADVAALKAQGVEFVSDVTPCCSGPDSSGSIVAFYDPDGAILELVEQPGMSQLFAIIAWFRNLF